MKQTDPQRITVSETTIDLYHIIGWRSIDDAIMALVEIQAYAMNEHGMTAEVEVDTKTEYGCSIGDPDETVMCIKITRLETADEVKKRLAKKRKASAAAKKAAITKKLEKEAKDKAEYERLRAIFGDE